MRRRIIHDSQTFPLLGRSAECQLLDHLISSMATGSRVLVLRGEAGVGKSSLLDYVLDQALEQAEGYRTTQVAGVESDMDLAYAGLQQLCRPLLGHLDELPETQREALAVALGICSGDTPQPRPVEEAVLSLLAAACRDRPLLCLIDDSQWLDHPSLDVLAFAARRFVGEHVALVFASRDVGAEALVGLPELVIGALSDEHARDLLGSVFIGRLDSRVSDRIIAETRGNPLALVALPRDGSAAEIAGAFRRGNTHPVTGRIEQNYIDLIGSLSQPTRQLLLAAAAEPLGDSAVLVRAASHLGIAAEALKPAVDAGVIDIDPHVRFCHPLARSAAYRAADPSERRDAHRALAEVTDAQADPDRRVWHTANAATWPDDAVAAQLEASAGRVRAKAGVAVAAMFLERAAFLTSVPEIRGDRALAAARAKLDAGALTDADKLLAMAELVPATELQRARAARLSAQMEFAKRRGGDTSAAPLREIASRMHDAAILFQDLDSGAVRGTYLEALAAAMYAGRLGDVPAVAQIAEAARSGIDRLPSCSGPVATVLRGMTDQITGRPYAAAELSAALEEIGTEGLNDDGHASRWMVPALPIFQQSSAYELWDDALVDRISTATVRRVRESGAFALLPETLAYRAVVHMLAGEFTEAQTFLAEAHSISTSIRYYTPLRYQSLALDAWKGDPADLDAIRAGADAALACGDGRVLGLARYATAVLCNGLGRYEDAFTAAQEASEYEDLGLYGWYLGELIEAATRIGNTEAAGDALERLTDRMSKRDTDWALGTLASARALVADDHGAEAHYLEAIDRLGCTRVRIHHARAHLRYGEWLRRRRRRSAAHDHLTAARDMFRRFGAQAFADRADRELTAKGDGSCQKQVVGGDHLTAKEVQIARLAGDGLTNSAIGELLFISTHTVEWHLRKVFVKLGITSRRQLRNLSLAG
ncbi:AAA family ATPase [Mycobacterium sp. 48b]|uniref:helix-turn-helix transcriptional regulator n=1 Tax=Mycobacterium sp. 48b TaxID=3400426 RepID=UPI003AAEA62F